MKRKKVIIYISMLNAIGGIETFIANFCRRMKVHYDILFLFSDADPKMLLKIVEHVPVERYHGQSLTCDYFISTSAWGNNADETIEAKKYVQMIHADYMAFKKYGFKYTKAKKTTHHVSVGQWVAEQFEQATGYKNDAVILNLL